MYKHLAWMTTLTVGRVIQFKVNIGANIFDAFHEVIAENNLHYGIVIGSCGALKSAAFRNVKEAPQSYPIEKSNLVSFECNQPMESTSLIGWFYHNGEQEMIHLHCSAARDEGGVPAIYGGHLVDAVAGPKMIITVQELICDNLYIGFDEQCKKTDLISHC
ncbi:MAG TPA: PPC domain-containing DNA-binding protein [Clostridia bacterium]|nr:PPC domain-containing DNA-binding protein [Clostridia bacterium]